MPHKRTTAELQQHGQILYKRADYKKALDLFNEAIESEPHPTVSLLDNRAATHDKLGDITSALKDAKTTIRIHEKDPTGYVRAGKLLEKAEKPDVALSIYKRGIKKKTQNIQLLVKLHDKLLRSTAPPTASDPFAELPLELVEIIMSHLTFRQIVYCTGVSKQWHKLIASLPSLWKVLDLRGSKKPVKTAFISLCLNRSSRNIKEAHLEKLYDTEKTIAALFQHCKLMHTLSIRQTGLQPPEFFHCFSKAKNLTKVYLGSGVRVTQIAVAALLRAAPSLCHVEIHGVATTSHRPTWDFDLPKLEVLVLGALEGDDIRRLSMSSLLPRAPNIRSLKHVGFASSAGLTGWDLHTCSNLQLLDVPYYGVFTIAGLPESLRVLRAHATSPTYPERLQPGTFFFPHLEELVVTSPRLANIMLSNPAVLPLLGAEIAQHWTSDQRIMTNIRKTEAELSKLRSLSISAVTLVDSWKGSRDFPVLLGSFRLSALQHLALTRSLLIDDGVAELIALNMPLLISLDLSVSGVTGYGLKKIVEACSHLKRVNMNQCERCGIDAVEWARSKGVKIDFMMNMKAGGSKVRE